MSNGIPAILTMLLLAALIGFIVDQVVQHPRQDVTSRLSPRSRRKVATRINARWAGRSMDDPYRGPVPTLQPRLDETARVMAEVRAGVAELNARTAELEAETERMHRARVDAELQAHVAEVAAQRRQALAGRVGGAA